MKKETKDTILIGLTLFAIFVGAGNLMLPPNVGVKSGNLWYLSTLGFIITGAGLPMLGVVAVSKVGGDANHLCDKANPIIIKILNIFILFIIGPLFAVPRTAAFTHEFTIVPLFNNISDIGFSIANINFNYLNLITCSIYFLICYLLIRSGHNGMTRIGRFLSPILITFIFIVIAISIVRPVGLPKALESTDKSVFYFGFSQGYQTMDGLGSSVLGGAVASFVYSFGYNKKNITKVLSKGAIICGILMSMVYVGLTWIGASASANILDESSRSNILSSALFLVSGKYGIALLRVMVVFACLTTAAGLIITFSDYFYELSGKKLAKKHWMKLTCFLCFIMSQIGVDGIINIASPVLSSVYPILITILALNIFGDRINKYAFRGSVYSIILLAPIIFLSEILGKDSIYTKILSVIPNFDHNFIFVPVAIVGFIIGLLISCILKKSVAKRAV